MGIFVIIMGGSLYGEVHYMGGSLYGGLVISGVL